MREGRYVGEQEICNKNKNNNARLLTATYLFIMMIKWRIAKEANYTYTMYIQ